MLQNMKAKMSAIDLLGISDVTLAKKRPYMFAFYKQYLHDILENPEAVKKDLAIFDQNELLIEEYKRKVSRIAQLVNYLAEDPDICRKYIEGKLNPKIRENTFDANTPIIQFKCEETGKVDRGTGVGSDGNGDGNGDGRRPGNGHDNGLGGPGNGNGHRPGVDGSVNGLGSANGPGGPGNRPLGPGSANGLGADENSEEAAEAADAAREAEEAAPAPGQQSELLAGVIGVLLTPPGEGNPNGDDDDGEGDRHGEGNDGEGSDSGSEDSEPGESDDDSESDGNGDGNERPEHGNGNILSTTAALIAAASAANASERQGISPADAAQAAAAEARATEEAAAAAAAEAEARAAAEAEATRARAAEEARRQQEAARAEAAAEELQRQANSILDTTNKMITQEKLTQISGKAEARVEILQQQLQAIQQSDAKQIATEAAEAAEAAKQRIIALVGSINSNIETVKKQVDLAIGSAQQASATTTTAEAEQLLEKANTEKQAAEAAMIELRQQLIELYTNKATIEANTVKIAQANAVSLLKSIKDEIKPFTVENPLPSVTSQQQDPTQAESEANTVTAAAEIYTKYHDLIHEYADILQVLKRAAGFARKENTETDDDAIERDAKSKLDTVAAGLAEIKGEAANIPEVIEKTKRLLTYVNVYYLIIKVLLNPSENSFQGLKKYLQDNGKIITRLFAPTPTDVNTLNSFKYSIDTFQNFGTTQQFFTNLKHYIPESLKSIFETTFTYENLRAQPGVSGGGYLGEYLTQKLDLLQNPSENLKNKEIAIEQLENDPVYDPNSMEISTTDRIIFVSTTYILRGLTLFLIDWAINSYLIDSFAKAFYMYLIIYTLLFMIIVLLANVNSESVFSKNFQLLFYYVNVENNGWGRILIHILIQILLLPIMIVVNQNLNPNMSSILDFDTKRKIYSIISNLTLFFWTLTSVICLRY